MKEYEYANIHLVPECATSVRVKFYRSYENLERKCEKILKESRFEEIFEE